jgi:pimeloyl-ACP methyl ester carboxylesterase
MIRSLRLAFAAAFLLPVWAGAAPDPRNLSVCRIQGIRTEVRCGSVQRLLDPARPRGPHIDVHYVVVPAVSRKRAADPVFLLAGGPGQSAISLAGDVLPLFARLHNNRDLVFVDQRGTGRSAPLDCPQQPLAPQQPLVDPDTEAREMLACRLALEKLPYIGAPADLGFFTTTLAMQDLDAVREALGAPTLDLVGASYGTRAALEYQRQFPTHLRRNVLDGVAPPDMVLPDSAATDNAAALQALWSACAAEPACHAAFPHLTADWDALKASLPRNVSVRDPRTLQTVSLPLTLPLLLGAVRGPLYSPVLTAALPQAITAAAHGNFQPLVTLGGLAAPHGRHDIAAGMHFSVICAEDAPRMARVSGDPATEFGDLFAAIYREVCAQWPRGAVPAAFYDVPRATQPVLLLSGGLDPMTPPRHAARIAAKLGDQALAVTVPNAGHGILSIGCISDVIYRFIAAPDAAAAHAVDTTCAQAIPRPLAFIPPHGDAP